MDREPALLGGLGCRFRSHGRAAEESWVSDRRQEKLLRQLRLRKGMGLDFSIGASSFRGFRSPFDDTNRFQKQHEGIASECRSRTCKTKKMMQQYLHNTSGKRRFRTNLPRAHASQTLRNHSPVQFRAPVFGILSARVFARSRLRLAHRFKIFETRARHPRALAQGSRVQW